MSDFFRQLRLDFIALCATTTGTVGRADLVRAFGIHTQQASLDLGAFIGQHPGVIRYDLTAKCYVATGRKCKRPHPVERLRKALEETAS